MDKDQPQDSLSHDDEKEELGLDRRNALRKLLGASSLLLGYPMAIQSWGQPLSPNSLGSDLKVRAGQSTLSQYAKGDLHSYSPTMMSFSMAPTASPTMAPSLSPTISITNSPTSNPTQMPTSNPTQMPTSNPTMAPSNSPTFSPVAPPSSAPTLSPTTSPTFSPIMSPTQSPLPPPPKYLELTDTHIEIFPCPTGKQFTVEGQLSFFIMEIRTLTNLLVFTIPSSGTVQLVDMSSQPSGSYFIFATHKTKADLSVQLMFSG